MWRCKISEILVFVPTYNSEKYLRQCLDSVLQQTFQDWQCVISDDASTDKSVEIAREYEKIDSRFKVLTHEKNVGAANNWNRAKENNNSFATKILCADDYLLKDAIDLDSNKLKTHLQELVNSYKINNYDYFKPFFNTELKSIKGLPQYVEYFLNKKASGKGSKLEKAGLITMSDKERAKVLADFKAGKLVK